MYVPSVAATDEKSGEFASTITAPKSPLAAPAVLPAASLIVPEYEDTERSVVLVSVPATVYLNTKATPGLPLLYVAVAPLDNVRVGVPVTVTASSHVTVISMLVPDL